MGGGECQRGRARGEGQSCGKGPRQAAGGSATRAKHCQVAEPVQLRGATHTFFLAFAFGGISLEPQTDTNENASNFFLFLFGFAGLLASNALCCELLCGHDVRRLRGRCQVRGAWVQALTCFAQQALLSYLMPALSPPAWHAPHTRSTTLL